MLYNHSLPEEEQHEEISPILPRHSCVMTTVSDCKLLTTTVSAKAHECILRKALKPQLLSCIDINVNVMPCHFCRLFWIKLSAKWCKCIVQLIVCKEKKTAGGSYTFLSSNVAD